MRAIRIALMACSTLSAVSGAPAILFTDIASGPTSGGHFNQGAPITIYGSGFGAERGASRVTIGGVEVADYILWGARNAANPELDKIVVLPGARVTGGPIIVTVGGVPSNGVPFVVRPGRLFLVSAGGNDANECSFERPCATLKRVIAGMRPGDTALLRGGTYAAADFELRAEHSGTADAPIGIFAYPREDVFVAGEGAVAMGANHIAIGGFHFVGGTITAARGVRFTGNTIPAGVRAEGEALVAGNSCETGGERVAAVCVGVVDGAGARVAHNRIAGALVGVRVTGGSGVTVEGNAITGARLGHGLVVDHTEAFTARNNVLANNRPAGIGIGAGVNGARLRHNTFFQNGRAGVAVDGDGVAGVEIRNNLFFQTLPFCDAGCEAVPLAHVYVAERSAGALMERNYYQTPQPVIYGGVDADPVFGDVFFHDSEAGNYRLAGGSAALDRAMALEGEDRDADGQARPRGAGPDVGAYEAEEGVAPPLPPPAPGQPFLSVDVPSLTFTAARGAGNPAAQRVTVYNAGDGALHWRATASEAWVQVTPAESTAPSEAVTIAVDAAGLEAGSHHATVVFRDADARQERRVAVAFVLTETAGGGGVAAGDPVIFFTDLESGPNSGGENNGGAVVTIYGKNFGAARGASTVTVGGGEVVAYKQWGVAHHWYEKIAVQIGSAARSGSLVVTVSGRASNAVPFTVRGGGIYFLGPNGSDANDGSFARPWRNAPAARDRMRPGDIVYLLDGFEQTSDDGQGWNTPLLLRTGGGADAPLTWAAYPGATATIGSTAGPGFGLRTADRDAFGYMVFAGIRFRGSAVGAMVSGVSAGAPGFRFVANDFEGREASCFITHNARNLAFHGNSAHDCGAASKTPELEHGVYFSTDSNGIDMGWNTVANIPSCRGVQVHSSPLEGPANGFNQYGIRIHHNVIRDTFCDGIVLATVDPSKGAVEVYNNLLLRAGYGTPINNHGFFSCFYSPGTTNRGAAGSGAVEVYNNTMVGCGNARAGDGWSAAVVNGGQNARLGVRLRNNIIVPAAGVPYALYGPLTGSNNLFSGGVDQPRATLAASLTADPAFVSATDFHLKPGSAAIDAGVATGLADDLDGTFRPTGAASDLGAYEFRP